jgi:hypothetical protein
MHWRSLKLGYRCISVLVLEGLGFCPSRFDDLDFGTGVGWVVAGYGANTMTDLTGLGPKTSSTSMNGRKIFIIPLIPFCLGLIYLPPRRAPTDTED